MTMGLSLRMCMLEWVRVFHEGVCLLCVYCNRYASDNMRIIHTKIRATLPTNRMYNQNL